MDCFVLGYHIIHVICIYDINDILSLSCSYGCIILHISENMKYVKQQGLETQKVSLYFMRMS